MWMATVLLVLAGLVPAAAAQQPDAEVERGVEQVENGEYDAAIFTLDTAARRLSSDAAQGAELARAYLYLGIAYFGKGHEAAAKARFRDAILSREGLSLDAEQFPPKIIDLFESAREETRTAAAPASGTPPPAATTAAASDGGEGGGGGGKTLLIVGGLAAAGGGIALAAGGGDGGDGGTPTSTAPGTAPGTAPSRPATVMRSFEGVIDDAQYQIDFNSPSHEIFVTGTGRVTANLAWAAEGGDRLGSLFVVLDDETFAEHIGEFQQTGETTGMLTAEVSLPSGATARTYYLGVGIESTCGGCVFRYVLEVLHP